MANYKIPNLPGARAYREEIADFWEVESIRNPELSISQIDISRILSIELDELNHDGIDSEDDNLNDGNSNRNGLIDVFKELKQRTNFCANKYPFNFGIQSIKICKEKNEFYKKIYLFLLLCARLNMQKQKIQNGIDATQLFENLCAHVAKNYFGNSSHSFVFGTANSGSFKDKVEYLIKNTGEGVKFKNPNNNPPTKKDDSVDIVVWKEFSDGKRGKLIGFGQCKTGTTTWRDGIYKLKPENFCSQWFLDEPIFNPIPIVFICDTLNEESNFYTSQKGFLFFNRFRILEYTDETLDEKIKEDINTWLKGALIFLNVVT